MRRELHKCTYLVSLEKYTFDKGGRPAQREKKREGEEEGQTSEATESLYE